MIAALLVLAQIAPTSAPPRPIVTTIAAIRADPKKFDGQIVRMHGWVNRCQPLDCSIYDRPDNAPGGRGQGLSIASDKKFDATIASLLPTYVEIDARFDAACLTKWICLDRAPDLTVIQLRGVIDPHEAPPED